MFGAVVLEAGLKEISRELKSDRDKERRRRTGAENQRTKEDQANRLSSDRLESLWALNAHVSALPYCSVRRDKPVKGSAHCRTLLAAGQINVVY
jgi:hypothetical protein